jgi:hypothetical protein
MSGSLASCFPDNLARVVSTKQTRLYYDDTSIPAKRSTFIEGSADLLSLKGWKGEAQQAIVGHGDLAAPVRGANNFDTRYISFL